MQERDTETANVGAICALRRAAVAARARVQPGRP